MRTEAFYEAMKSDRAKNNLNLQATERAGLEVTVFDYRCPKAVLEFLTLDMVLQNIFSVCRNILLLCWSSQLKSLKSCWNLWMTDDNLHSIEDTELRTLSTDSISMTMLTMYFHCRVIVIVP